MRALMILGLASLLAASAAATVPQNTIVITTAVPAIPHEPPIQEIHSPDGALVVLVAEGHGGVVLSVTDTHKREVASEGHYPEDRPQGFWFKQGAWTPNSQYFVYSMTAWRDTGHTPPDMPIYVYSRSKNVFFNLGKDVAEHVGIVKPGKFSLSFPDDVGLEVIDSKNHSDKLITVQLSQLKLIEESKH